MYINPSIVLAKEMQVIKRNYTTYSAKLALVLFGASVSLCRLCETQPFFIRPVQTARSGWDKSFQKMASSGDDLLLDANTSTNWDNKEWEWK
jgi:hypothetical protein